MQTVRGNYKGYTKREVLKAKEARRAQAMMGVPSEENYKGRWQRSTSVKQSGRYVPSRSG